MSFNKNLVVSGIALSVIFGIYAYLDKPSVDVRPIAEFSPYVKGNPACRIMLTKSTRSMTESDRTHRCRNNSFVTFYNPLEKNMGKYASTLCPNAVAVFADKSSFELSCIFKSSKNTRIKILPN